MARQVIRSFLALAFTSPVVFAQDAHVLTGAIEAGLVEVSTPLDSWLDGGAGKLRYSDDDTLVLNRAFAQYRGRLSRTVNVHATLNLNGEGARALDLTEAYLELRPVPRRPLRTRWRLGAFYPRLSLEHVDRGWGTQYTLSPSAINTWVGEELRTVGAEFTLERSRHATGSLHELSLHAAVFFANDPAGALLVWKGWSLHDRQSGLRSRLPVPIPGLSVEPIQEIDDRPGYYLGGEWRYGRRLLLRVMHYDNRGDPEAFRGGGYGWDSGEEWRYGRRLALRSMHEDYGEDYGDYEGSRSYAWDTRFEQLGAQLALPADVGLIAQWMKGVTLAGPVVGPRRLVDAEFDAWFVLLTRAFGAHRLSVRYDDFHVREGGDRLEAGHAYTLAYLQRLRPRLDIGVEWLRIASDSAVRPAATEEQLQLTARWRFGLPGSAAELPHVY